MDTSQRLRDARVGAGFASASDAARALGVGVSTYLGHENGHRGFTVEDATRYAKRFGVSLDWLLLGKGEFISPQRAVNGTPIVGTLDLRNWAEREPISLDDATGEQLEIAMLTGHSDQVWFAVRVPAEFPAEHMHEGDFLICRQSDEVEHGRMGVVERTASGGPLGTLRQLALVACTKSGSGDWRMVIRPQRPNEEEKPLDGEYRVLGEVVNALRAF